MVQSRTPPPPDELPGTLKVCKRVWPKDNGGTVVLDDDWTKTVDDWEKAKHLAKTNAKKSKILEAKILGEMRENSFGKLSDGTYLSNRANKAGTRTLKRFIPKGR